MNSFVNIIQAMANLGTPAYVMGDFSVNLLKYPRSSRACELVQAVVSYSFLYLY